MVFPNCRQGDANIDLSSSALGEVKTFDLDDNCIDLCDGKGHDLSVNPNVGHGYEEISECVY
ncbi:hypothetical protein H257_16922 [Aphanomyces astaci]|uniref:Uncharacterized protein n=1 Tax=Aphanomyces astaci TaxID=112090 RepID=W4FGS0_APHAT|nr:hypothetical protein H257_16922 [Aphanomyces astaci]ETV66712.1 hypothetical protein H257_16922 [Aphanomyces astaci]|eukprot:XP_009843837.1 hypothetical protein H257_16922 [Aphanomyces astaci]